MEYLKQKTVMIVNDVTSSSYCVHLQQSMKLGYVMLVFSLKQFANAIVPKLFNDNSQKLSETLNELHSRKEE